MRNEKRKMEKCLGFATPGKRDPSAPLFLGHHARTSAKLCAPRYNGGNDLPPIGQLTRHGSQTVLFEVTDV